MSLWDSSVAGRGARRKVQQHLPRVCDVLRHLSGLREATSSVGWTLCSFTGQCVIDDMQCALTGANATRLAPTVARNFLEVLKSVYLAPGHKLDDVKTVVAAEGSLHWGLRPARDPAACGGRQHHRPPPVIIMDAQWQQYYWNHYLLQQQQQHQLRWLTLGQ